MAEMRDYAAGAAGLGVGGLLGGQIADSDAANSLLVRYLTRKAPAAGRPDFRVPVYAGADVNLEHGSGENIMAARISNMLNRNGIGSYYVNTGGIPSAEWKDSRSPAVNRSIRLWRDDARISGKNLGNLRRMVVNLGSGDRRALSLLMSAMVDDGVSPRNALQALRSGMFDGFTAGELLDTFRSVGKGGVASIVEGRSHVVPNSAFRAQLQSAHMPHFLSGEAGMGYTSLLKGKQYKWDDVRRMAKGVAENSYPFSNAPGTRNLTLDTQFQPNYRGPTDQLIPGSGMYDPGFGRRSRWARMWKYYHGGEREAYHAVIARLAEKAGIDPKTLTPGTKYMLISTGSAGANAAEKLRLAEKAFASDPNVRILMQYGKDNARPASSGLDLYTNNGINEEIARINRARPGFVIGFGKDPDYGLLARNVDLHGTYGGSSTITEALANTNPTVTMSDTLLNRRNNNYGTARRGIQQIDSAATAIGRELRNGTGLGTVVNSRDGRQTLGQAIEEFGLSGADYGKIERDAVQKLRDAMYNSPGKFDPKAVDAANAMLAEQAARNKTFVDTVRRMVTNAIDRRDVSAYRRMRPGVGKSLAGLSRALFRTPAGRRIGLPLALASALGLGGGAFAASRAAHSGGK